MQNILIVDDEPIIQEVLRAALEAPERVIHSASSYAEGLQRGRALEPLDLALVDKNLLDGSGLDLIRELKGAGRDTEFILVTGYASMESAIAAIGLDLFDYITKPFDDLRRVERQVANALSRVRLKREEERLRGELGRSEERYRRLFEVASDAILVVDAASGRIEQANPAARYMYGYRDEELRGLPHEALFAPAQDATPEVQEFAGAALHRKKDGVTFWVESMRNELTVGDERVIIEMARDVTERIRAAEKNQQLETRARQAEKMQALGRLAGGIAHDFANMVQVINSYAQFLIDGLASGDPDPADAQAILEAGERSGSLARQLLVFSRQQPVRTRVLVINELTRRMESLLRHTIGEEISFNVDLAPALWPVDADPSQLEQVLLNLVLNARDAVARAGRIELRTRNVEIDAERGQRLALRPGRYVTLQVCDNGCGVPAEVAQRVFEPFFTTKEEGRGTGMGLATVHGIVQRSGGEVVLEPATGAGACFTVYLPAVAIDSMPADAPSSQPATSRSGPVVVLVVEDDEIVRRVICRLLQRHEVEVIEAGGGEEAERLVAEHAAPVSLVLTDVVMPGMSGIELARRLGERPDPPAVLFMTAYSDERFVEEGLSLEEVSFLQKPFTEETLMQEVWRALSTA